MRAEEKLNCPHPVKGCQMAARRPMAAELEGRAHNFWLSSLDDDMLLGGNTSEEIKNNNNHDKAG